MLKIATVLLIAAMSVPALAASNTLTGRAYVIDGDTISINRVHIRMFGVDAPEHDQYCNRGGEMVLCGMESKQALQNLIGDRDVSCDTLLVESATHAKAGYYLQARDVSICHVGGIEINSWLVSNGWAVEYTHFSRGRYAQESQEAQEAHAGIWASQFQNPWDFRHGQ